MVNFSILIYGANGYTGKKLAKYLLEQGLSPILAGRGKDVETFANSLHCQYRVFKVDDAESYLKDVDIVVNVAGAFSHTQVPLIEACLNTKTHYLDISGEYVDVNRVYQFDDKARAVGVVLMPAVGIFSAPMDLVAKLAAQKINEPTKLKIGFASTGKPSKGSIKTALSKIQSVGVQLYNGEYIETSPASKELAMNIYHKDIGMVTHPWRADLLLAKLSTGINTIETYNGFPSFMVKMMRGKMKWLKVLMEKWLIRYLPEGPNEAQQKSALIYAKAIASNDKEETSTAELIGPDAYAFTVAAIFELSKEVVKQPELSGFLTPSQLGIKWAKNIDGVLMKVNEQSLCNPNTLTSYYLGGEHAK